MGDWRGSWLSLLFGTITGWDIEGVGRGVGVFVGHRVVIMSLYRSIISLLSSLSHPSAVRNKQKKKPSFALLVPQKHIKE